MINTKHHFAVIGRIPEDDEDSVLFYHCETPKQARKYFDREIYEIVYSRTGDAVRARRNSKQCHGVTTFITTVIKSESELSLVED